MPDEWNQIGLLIEHNCAAVSFDAEAPVLDHNQFIKLINVLEIGLGLSNFMFIVKGDAIYEDIKDNLLLSNIDQWNVLVDSEVLADDLYANEHIRKLYGIRHVAVQKDARLETLDYECDIEMLDWASYIVSEKGHMRNLSYGQSYQEDYALKVLERLGEFTHHSIMGLLAIHFNEHASLSLSRFHSFAGYDLELDEKSLITRPAVRSVSSRCFLESEVRHFETLINRKSVRERDLQVFFEENPHFLGGINPNICRVYPQVFLKRGDERPSLVPDFVLEPLGNKWCELLEIKLPSVSITAGPKSRRRLSHSVCDGIAQLEEYRHYFEDPRNRRRFQELMRAMGSKSVDCYYPCITLVIGLDPTEMNEEQIRRSLMTTYRGVNIVTYGQIAAHARRNLLL